MKKKVKIGVLSDLHMEFDVHSFMGFDFVPEPDVTYICAGDIHSNIHLKNLFISKHKDHMVSIDGNHDFYMNGRSFKESINDTLDVNINGIAIGGATLWTDLSNEIQWRLYSRSLNDCGCIKDLDYQSYKLAHETHKKFLFDPNNKFDAIVTHHGISRKSVHPKYDGDPINICFYTELEKEILNMKNPPKLWISGHTHEEFDYMIGNTRVICHPRGYPREQPWYYNYQPKIVEIEI